MALPKPVWSNDVIRNSSSLNWGTWNNDPATLAVLQTVASCWVRLGRDFNFGSDIADFLGQQRVCIVFSLIFIERALVNSFQAPLTLRTCYDNLIPHPFRLADKANTTSDHQSASG